MALNQITFGETFRKLFPHLDSGSVFVVGFSGGCDSWTLLHLLKELHIPHIAAHLHHGMRPEADEEAKFLEEECQKRDITFVLGRARVPDIAHARRIGIEEAGREARYHFLEKVRAGMGANYIATAHTLDDQVETFFLHAIRGAGLKGIGGMHPIQGPLVRPLLSYPRSETEAYCRSQNLPVLLDPGNENTQFSRVRIRKNVVPELEKISSGFPIAIARSMQIWRDEDEMLNGLAAHAISHCKRSLNGPFEPLTSAEEIAIDIPSFFQQARPMRRRMVALIATYFGADLTFDQIEKVAGDHSDEKGSMTSEAGEVIVTWDSNLIHFELAAPPQVPPMEMRLGSFIQAENRSWTLEAKSIPSASEHQKRNSFSAQIQPQFSNLKVEYYRSEWNWKIKPLGFDHHRKVSDLLSEAKLTRLAKAALPIICDESGPIWIPGICPACRAAAQKGQPATELIFNLSVSP